MLIHPFSEGGTIEESPNLKHLPGFMPGSFHPISLRGDSSHRLGGFRKGNWEKISFPEGES